ncbi:hypothetical protein ACWEKM_33420 [Streptomyces sp. NPDC004752]
MRQLRGRQEVLDTGAQADGSYALITPLTVEQAAPQDPVHSTSGRCSTATASPP